MIDGLREAIRERQALPGPVRLRGSEHRHRPAPEFHRRVLPVRRSSAIPFTPQPAISESIARSRMTSPASAFVFKTMADPFAGRVTYFKVYSGVVKNDDHLLNMRTEHR